MKKTSIAVDEDTLRDIKDWNEKNPTRPIPMGATCRAALRTELKKRKGDNNDRV